MLFVPPRVLRSHADYLKDRRTTRQQLADEAMSITAEVAAAAATQQTQPGVTSPQGTTMWGPPAAVAMPAYSMPSPNPVLMPQYLPSFNSQGQHSQQLLLQQQHAGHHLWVAPVDTDTSDTDDDSSDSDDDKDGQGLGHNRSALNPAHPLAAAAAAAAGLPAGSHSRHQVVARRDTAQSSNNPLWGPARASHAAGLDAAGADALLGGSFSLQMLPDAAAQQHHQQQVMHWTHGSNYTRMLADPATQDGFQLKYRAKRKRWVLMGPTGTAEQLAGTAGQLLPSPPPTAADSSLQAGSVSGRHIQLHTPTGSTSSLQQLQHQGLQAPMASQAIETAGLAAGLAAAAGVQQHQEQQQHSTGLMRAGSLAMDRPRRQVKMTAAAAAAVAAAAASESDSDGLESRSGGRSKPAANRKAAAAAGGGRKARKAVSTSSSGSAGTDSDSGSSSDFSQSEVTRRRSKRARGGAGGYQGSTAAGTSSAPSIAASAAGKPQTKPKRKAGSAAAVRHGKASSSKGSPKMPGSEPSRPMFEDTRSKYRGVTRHRRSGRWEAHIWIKELGR